MCAAWRSGVICAASVVRLHEFFDGQLPRSRLVMALAAQLLEALVEMLRQFLDDLELARTIELQARELRADVRCPLRHGPLR